MGEKKKSDPQRIIHVESSTTLTVRLESRTSKTIRIVPYIPDSVASKLTIDGNSDPAKLREAKKTKKVKLISPQPKKKPDYKAEKNTGDKKAKEPNNENQESKGKADKKQPDDKTKKNTNDKKTKEPPVKTAVLKIALGCQCQGCFDRIDKIVRDTKGVHNWSIHKEKETVTVKGTMDVKTLAETLFEKLKKKVEVVPPKK